MTDDRKTPVSAMKVLMHIAELAREGATVDIKLRLHEGGVRGYRVERDVNVKDLPNPPGVE